jgi:hypothetical protein
LIDADITGPWKNKNFDFEEIWVKSQGYATWIC